MSDPDARHLTRFEQERNALVDSHVVPRGVTDPGVLAALRRVPRHEFVPDHLRHSAYEDQALPIGEGQTISQPLVVALMTQALALSGNERVLEVGTGSGYQCAILAELAGRVISIERNELLSSRAETVLRSLGYSNVELVVGDGSLGHPDGAPYDRIMVTAACPTIPPPLVEQLAPGGRMVLPLGERHCQELVVLVKSEDGIERSVEFGCVFVPLIGRHGWHDV